MSKMSGGGITSKSSARSASKRRLAKGGRDQPGGADQLRAGERALSERLSRWRWDSGCPSPDGQRRCNNEAGGGPGKGRTIILVVGRESTERGLGWPL